MGPGELKDLIELVGTPGTIIALGVIFFFMLRGIRSDVTELKQDMKAIHNNGFVRKEMLQEVKESHAMIHQDLEDRIVRVEGKLFR